jgi:hypothetical protein
MATAAAMAALRTMVLGDCGGGSSNEDGCRDSGDDDNGKGGNGMVMIALCCCHCSCIFQCTTKRVMTWASKGNSNGN